MHRWRRPRSTRVVLLPAVASALRVGAAEPAHAATAAMLLHLLPGFAGGAGVPAEPPLSPHADAR